MKRKILMLICVVVIMFATIFSSLYHSQISKEETQNEYLSFTAYKSIGVDKLEASICKYNLQSKKVSEIFRFPINAMYALGVYDKKTNSVYYSKEIGNDSYERKHTVGDQIYVYNLATGSDTMLTDDLIAVNDIIPVDDMIFFLGARQRNPNSLILGKIDLSDGSINYWNQADTAGTRILSVDRVKKRLYVAIYDVEEEYQTVILGNSSVPPTHIIYSYDYNLSNRQEVLRAENKVIKSIYTINNRMLYTTDDAITPSGPIHTLTQIIDLDTMKVLFELKEGFPQIGCLSADAKGAYLLADIGTFEGICYFNFETQEYTPIVESTLGNIANFQLIY